MPPCWGRKAVRVADLNDFATAVGGLIKGRATVPERVNLAPSPGFETGITGWNAARASSAHEAGALRATVTADGASYAYATATPVTPGDTLTLGYTILGGASAVDAWLSFQTSTGTTVETTPVQKANVIPGEESRVIYAAIVPDGAAQVQIVVGSATRVVGDVYWISDVTVESMPFKTDAEPFVSPVRMGVWEAISYATGTAPEGTGTVDPLTGWRDTLAHALHRPVNVLAVGDSITEGTGTSTLSSRWINVAQNHLRNAVGATQGAAFPFIPAKYATSAPGQPVTSSGNVTDNSATGLGWRAVDIRDDTGKVTFTFTGTSAAVVVSKASGTGIMSVTVDGGTPVTYDTNSANGGGSGAFLWPVPAITARGVHTVTIHRDPATATGRTILLHGLATWDGDEAMGVRVHDSGHHGWGYTTTNQARIDSLGVTLAGVVKPDLIISAFGTNDIGKNDPAGYRASAQAYLDKYHSAAPGVPVLLVHMYRIQAHTEAQNSAYRAVLAELAAADPLVEFVDLRRHMPDIPTPHDAVPSQGLYAEGIHPNDYGHARIADAITGILA